MVTVPVTGCVQPGVPDEVMLIRLKIGVEVYVFVMVAVPEALSVIVWFGPPFILYVTMALAVPVNVTVALCPEQTVAFAEIVTIGVGRTVIVTLPVIG